MRRGLGCKRLPERLLRHRLLPAQRAVLILAWRSSGCRSRSSSPPANAPEREVAAELLERALQPGQTVVADKDFAGEEFEQLVASHGCQLLRPDRKNERPRHGSLGGVRQWIESIIQLSAPRA